MQLASSGCRQQAGMQAHRQQTGNKQPDTGANRHTDSQTDGPKQQDIHTGKQADRSYGNGYVDHVRWHANGQEQRHGSWTRLEGHHDHTRNRCSGLPVTRQAAFRQVQPKTKRVGDSWGGCNLEGVKFAGSKGVHTLQDLQLHI